MLWSSLLPKTGQDIMTDLSNLPTQANTRCPAYSRAELERKHPAWKPKLPRGLIVRPSFGINRSPRGEGGLSLVRIRSSESLILNRSVCSEFGFFLITKDYLGFRQSSPSSLPLKSPAIQLYTQHVQSACLRESHGWVETLC